MLYLVFHCAFLFVFVLVYGSVILIIIIIIIDFPACAFVLVAAKIITLLLLFTGVQYFLEQSLGDLEPRSLWLPDHTVGP